MGLLSKITTTLAVATTTGFSLLGTPTQAFTITQNNSGQDLLNALLGDTTGLSGFSITPTGDARAFGLVQNDPFGLKSNQLPGVVLSTGIVETIPGVNQYSNTSHLPQLMGDVSYDFYPDYAPGDPRGEEGDSITLDISFYADDTVENLFFEYVFASEEFPEFGGQAFNDIFELWLNGVNLAKLSDGQTVSINNLVPNPQGSYHPDYIDNPAGPNTVTKLDGYTKVLGFEGKLRKNDRNTLTIKVADTGDGRFDSAVFIQGRSLRTKAQQSETPQVKDVPEPGVLLGLFGIGIWGVTSQFKRDRKAQSSRE